MGERLVRRIERHLRRCGRLRTFEDEAEPGGEGDPEGNLAASAVSGQAPPAGPQWVRITLKKAYVDGTVAVRGPRSGIAARDDAG